MVVEVRTLEEPKYLALNAVQRLFHAAFSDCRLFPQGFEGMIEEVVDMIGKPHTSVLLGIEDDIPIGLLIIRFPTSRITQVPQILHFYNGGSGAVRKNLLKSGAALVKARGYTKVWAINGTDSPDSVWARAFRVAGPASHVGGIMEFDLGATT